MAELRRKIDYLRWFLAMAVLAAAVISMVFLGINLYQANQPGSDPSARMEEPLFREPVGMNQQRVLFLNSYEPTFTSADAQKAGILDALYPKGISCDVEYMRSHIDVNPAGEKDFRRRIGRRMNDVHYEGVIAGDDAALQFVMDHRNTLFQDLPVVFLAVNDADRAKTACEMGNTTGILEYADLARTIRAAEKLMPGAKRVVGIVDSTLTGIGDQKAFRRVYSDFPDLKFEMLNSSDMTHEAFGRKLKTYGKDTILIHISCFSDADGAIYSIPESASYISKCAKVPVFRCNAGGIGNGILGGRIMDFRHSGYQAGRLMVRAMEGEDLSKIPPKRESKGIFLFDYSVMQRFGINRDDLPEGSLLINYNPSYWEANKQILIPGMIVILGFLALSVLSLRAGHINRRYAQKMEKMTLRDPLTGTGSMYAFEKNIHRFLGEPLIAVFCDLDNFRYFNDVFGHTAGDQILKAFGRALQERCGIDNCFRFGGDEFLILVRGSDVDRCRQIYLDLSDRLSHLEIDGKTRWIRFSCGYVTGTPQTEEELQEMVRLADLHIFRAKDMKDIRFAGGSYVPGAADRDAVDQEFLKRTARRNRDALTGLLTLDYFFTKVTELIGDGMIQFDWEPCFVYLDIRNFKVFNQEKGYDAGDELLKSAAKILMDVFPHRSICRVAEDHFIMMVYRKEYERGLEKITHRIGAAHPSIPVLPRFGICPVTEDGSPGMVYDHARIACESIRNSKQQIRIYDEELEKEEKKRSYILAHVDEAAEKGYIRPWYQPITDSRSNRVVFLETLARWEDPVKGMIPVGDFIPVLEENDEIVKVDLAVIRGAIRDFACYRAAGGKLIPVSVNLSRRDFNQADMVREISHLMDDAGLSHDLLNIEITESSLMGDRDFALRVIDEFHRAGFRVWMDDFGSGYSSLNFLQSANFDLLKLDMQFMEDFRPGTRSAVVVRSTLAMAAELGAVTLAEGVENEEQAELLRSMGCILLQGYYYSQPIPPEQVVTYLRETGYETDGPFEG